MAEVPDLANSVLSRDKDNHVSFAFRVEQTVLVAYTNTASAAVRLLDEWQASRDVMLYNAGDYAVAVTLGDASVVGAFPTATASKSIVVPSGAVMIINTIDAYMSAIAASGNSGNLYVSVGKGI